MHAKEIRQPPRREVRRIAEREIRIEVLWAHIAVSRKPVVVAGGQTHVDPGLAVADRLGRDTGVFQCLPRDFEQQPLLGIHRDRFTRGDPEELGVEFVGLPGGEEAPLPIADRARPGVVFGEVSVGVPAVLGHPDHTADPVVQQLPVFGGRAHATGEPGRPSRPQRSVRRRPFRRSPAEPSGHRFCVAPR